MNTDISEATESDTQNPVSVFTSAIIPERLEGNWCQLDLVYNVQGTLSFFEAKKQDTVSQIRNSIPSTAAPGMSPLNSPRS